MAPVSELLATTGQSNEAGKNATEANVDTSPCNDVADEEPKPKVTEAEVSEPKSPAKRKPIQRSAGEITGRGKTK